MTELLTRPDDRAELPKIFANRVLNYDTWLDAIYGAAIHPRARTMARQEQRLFWTPEDFTTEDAQDPLGLLADLHALQEASGDELTAAIADELDVAFAPQLAFMADDWDRGIMPRWGTITGEDGRDHIIYNHSPAFRMTGRILRVAGRISTETQSATWGYVPQIDLSPRRDGGGTLIPYEPGARVVTLPHPQYALPPDVMRQHLIAFHNSVHPRLLERRVVDVEEPVV